MRRERLRELTVMAALAAAVTLFFADILFAGFNLYIRDVARVYYPERRVLAEILRKGEFPFWNPYVNGGQPLAANPGYELFYPLQWLLPLGNFRDMFHLVIVVHYPLAALGMYLLTRSLGTRRSAAAVAGFAYALGGAMLSMSALIPFLYSMAWLPWIALFFRRAVKRRSPCSIAAAALSLGVMLLIGDVSMILQSGALIGAYALWTAVKERSAKPIALAVATVVLATAIGAVQIFPALDLQRDSARSQPLSFEIANTWSMPPVRILETIWPTLFGAASPEVNFQWGLMRLYPAEAWPWVINLYPGIVVMLLVIAGFACRVRGALFTAIVALAGFLLSIGRFGFAFPLLYHAGLKSLRYPEKFILSTIFVLAVFAGVVAEEAIRDLRVRRRMFFAGVAVTVVSGFISVMTMLPAYPQWFARVWLLKEIDLDLAARFRAGMLLTLALTAMVTLILGAERLSPRLRFALVALIVVVDLGVRVQGWMPRITAEYYDPPLAAVALTKSAAPARIYNAAEWQIVHTDPRRLPAGIVPWSMRNGLFPSWEMTFGLEGAVDIDVTSTNLLPSSQFASMFHRLESKRLPLLMQMAGASHVATLQDLDPAVVDDPRRFDEVQPVQFVAAKNAGPFYFAESLIDSPQAMFSDAALPLRTAVVNMRPFQPAPGRILSAQRTFNTVTLDVEAAGRSLLVLTVTPHRYWRATVDGAPAELRIVNVGFQGLVIDRGRHHIAMRYRNPLVVACAWISLLATILVLVVPIAARLRAAPSRQSGDVTGGT